MFEKTLQDLVKGIRSNKNDPSIYISQCIQEIKQELKSNDTFVKAQAIRKLTYLHMIGYDMTWAAFHVVEVMSYERFAHKRIGYLAASQSFTQSTDVVLLCTNLFKKEFGSLNEFEVGLAINCLSNIVTTDLSRDLLGDVIRMMTISSPYIRKKSVLVLYKMFLRYPQGLRLTFDQLKERMEESDISVVSCSVNVICELANKKPKNYLGLAPNFFRLLTTSSNNWMLIKVVKLIASLVPEEPRLARKLLDPLATIIQNTPAKSLLYECINTVTVALLYTKKNDGSQPKNVPAIVRLCNDHLRKYIEDPDQNLRYLGLIGLSNLMKSHSYVVKEHQEIILECLNVDDVTIKIRSLELISNGVINEENAPDVVKTLMQHAVKSDGGYYRNELVNQILVMCSRNKYQNVLEFEWYVQVLVDLAHLPGSSSKKYTFNGANYDHGKLIASQLIDIAVRVEYVRNFVVKNMVPMLLDESTFFGQGKNTMEEVLYAAAFITGEFSDYLCPLDEVESESSDDDDEDQIVENIDEMKNNTVKHNKIIKNLNQIHDIIDAMLQPRTTNLPSHVQAVYMQSILKLVSRASSLLLSLPPTNGTNDRCLLEKIGNKIMHYLPLFLQSEYIEVQERAYALREILLSYALGLDEIEPNEKSQRIFDSSTLNTVDTYDYLLPLSTFFKEKLQPVSIKAQNKVPIPEGLDLESVIYPEECQFLEKGFIFNENIIDNISFVPGDPFESNNVNAINRDEQRNEEYLKNIKQDHGYHANGDTSSDYDKNSAFIDEQEKLRKDPFYLSKKATNPDDIMTDNIPVVYLDENMHIKKEKKKKKAQKKKKRTILMDDAMPEGATASCSSTDEKKKKKKKKSNKRNEVNDDEDLADIDLTVPLREDERIPDQHLYHHQVSEKISNKSSEIESKKKKKKKKKSHDNQIITSDNENEIGKEVQNKIKKKKKEKDKKDEILIDLMDLDTSHSKTTNNNILSTPINDKIILDCNNDDDKIEKKFKKKKSKSNSSTSTPQDNTKSLDKPDKKKKKKKEGKTNKLDTNEPPLSLL